MTYYTYQQMFTSVSKHARSSIFACEIHCHKMKQNCKLHQPTRINVLPTCRSPGLRSRVIKSVHVQLSYAHVTNWNASQISKIVHISKCIALCCCIQIRHQNIETCNKHQFVSINPQRNRMEWQLWASRLPLGCMIERFSLFRMKKINQ